MLQFSDFDQRGYRTVDARTGYSEWAPAYEDVVQDDMDLALLENLSVPDWPDFRTVADLACGTGRTGAWLRSRGTGEIDGIDLTPGMLTLAAEKRIHRRLLEADVASTGLSSGDYDLVIASLVDEHLEDIRPLYAEAFRLASGNGTFVIVGFHPHFIMASGMPTHFNSASGEPVAIETHVHLLSDHVSAGISAGWALAEMGERLVDDTWIALKPKWERFRHQPVSFAMVWRKTH